MALLSEEVMATVSLALVARFQLASTALTVRLNAVPALWAVGVPVLPLAVPGAAVSPGARICSLVKAAALTVMDGLVLAVLVPSVISVAVRVPGAAVSPGTSSCSLLNAPPLTVIDGLVLALLVPSLLSLAVTVALPAVLSVTLKVLLPATSAALAGKLALASEEVMAAVSVTVLTRFQLASTALTVTLKAKPAVWAGGEPVLPVVVPGAAGSPGTNMWSFTK